MGGTAWPVCLVVLGLAQLVHAQAGPGARYNYKSSLVYFLFVFLSKINMNIVMHMLVIIRSLFYIMKSVVVF